MDQGVSELLLFLDLAACELEKLENFSKHNRSGCRGRFEEFKPLDGVIYIKHKM